MWKHSNGSKEQVADYVGTSLYQCVRPWLNMLNMYQGMGREREFRIIARRLNDDFNLGLIHWNAGAEVPNPGAKGCLEAYPHIVQHITECWGLKECQEYVNSLLEDNRAGVRKGFSLGAFEELLLLAELLEAQLPPQWPEGRPESKAAVRASDPLWHAAMGGVQSLLRRLINPDHKGPGLHA